MKTTSISARLEIYARMIATIRHLIFRRAWLWTRFLAFAAVALGSQPARAAVTEAWVHRFSNVVNNGTDEAVKVVRDAAGDIIVTGSTTGDLGGAADMLTIKYSGADGAVLWQQRYNGPANSYDSANAMAVDGNGNVVVTGRSQPEPGVSEIYTAKYAATDGALLWEKRYGTANSYDFPAAVVVDGSGNVVVTGSSGGDSYTAKYAAADGVLLWENRYNGPANSYDSASAVAVDGSGNVVVAGNSNTNDHPDSYTAKYAAADGALLWEKHYGPANSWGQATAVAVDGSGNVIVTGISQLEWGLTDYYTAKYAASDGALVWEQRYDDSDDAAGALAVDGSGNVVVTGTSGGDYYTAKYAARDGALLWEKRYDGLANGSDYVNAVAVDGSGNVVVTGSSHNGTNRDYYTARYAAADGALLWEKRYNGPANRYNYGNAVAVDGSGNVVVTGRTDAVPGGPLSPTRGSDYYTAKYAATDGALLWEKRYTGSKPNDASARAVAVDGSGTVVVTGVAYNWDGFQISDGDYYTARYAAADGALLWEKRYNGPANRDDFAKAVAVDGSGNVVVTGSSTSAGESGDYDYYTAKYAATNGALLWERRYNGPAADSFDDPYAMAVDGSGNVVVTGQSFGSNSDDAYYTAKYAAADGALLWEKRANGGGTAVAVDGSGNVVVTGYSYSGSTNSDYYTARYAAANGTLLWERRYNGPANGSDEAYAVAVDGSGNVVVTGRSGSDANYDYYTARYAAADGALLWEKRYNGPANSQDIANAVAVDGSGNVVVTGGSQGDYYTAKYAAADGALLWEKRYNGPANSSDYARAVAVDGSGNVVVTGDSWSGNSIVDYYTARYASADGGLLWEKRFTGPASVGDSSHCLALGPYGMVTVTGTPMGAVADTFNGGYATVVYQEIPEVVSINLVPTGVRLRFTGVSGRTYNIERTPDLKAWSTINTQTAPESGLLEYVDTLPHPRSGFYRIVQP